MKGGSPPSQCVVARRARVARSTVSMALNGDPRIAAKTRARISRIAEQLQYHPQLNFEARRLAHRRNGRVLPMDMLGVVWIRTAYHAAFASYQRQLVNGMTNACYAVNQCLLVVNLPWDRRRFIQHLVQLDGVILLGAEPDVVQLAQHLRKPIVTIQMDYPGLADVRIDDRAAVRLAFEHLFSRGHRQIGWIGPRTDHYPSLNRWAAYRECLADHGLPVNPRHVLCEGELTMELQGAASFKKLWSNQDRPTAFVVYNDMMALGALRGAREMGVRVPEDVSFVSIDDIPEASLAQPPLTTVAIGIEELGHRAALLLEEFVRTGTYRPERIQLKNLALKERGTVQRLQPTK